MIRIKRPRRILPDARATTSWPESSFTLKVALRSVAVTVPCALNTSSDDATLLLSFENAPVHKHLGAGRNDNR